MTSYAVVVPTLGRPSLGRLLASLAAQEGPAPERVVLVDDRGDPTPPLTPAGGVELLHSGGRGPAAARNLGWRALPEYVEWVAFLDDDVELPPGWASSLAADLAVAERGRFDAPGGSNLPRSGAVGGTQGRIVVPLPHDRRPTDWERCTAGLERAAWATADMSYRRVLLEQVHGFDERFPRAYREDADLALRVQRAGWALVRGQRHVVHPVRPAGPWASVRAQRGNADDALMRRLHGAGWRQAAQAPPGRRPWHVVTTGAAVVALGAGATAAVLRSRPAGALAAAATAVWSTLTAELAVARIAPGPRTRGEVATMLATSVALPPAAVWHWLRGAWRSRDAAPWPPVEAVLLDRDGTIVVDVPYNGDPQRVAPTAGAARALARLRRRGLRLGVVTNQSGVARGLLTPADVAAVNARIESLLGPFESWQVCPHGPSDGCACRKPEPGMVLSAAAELGVAPERCVLIGDTGADVSAAHAAGARAVLVPNAVTRPEEVRDAPVVAASIGDAVRLVLVGAA